MSGVKRGFGRFMCDWDKDWIYKKEQAFACSFSSAGTADRPLGIFCKNPF